MDTVLVFGFFQQIRYTDKHMDISLNLISIRLLLNIANDQ